MTTKTNTPVERIAASFMFSLVLTSLAFHVSCGTGKPADAKVNTDVLVAISPASLSMSPGGSANFNATVQNSANTQVTWSTDIGRIIGTGSTITYVAPSSVSAPTTATLKATSAADSTKFATASILVTSPPFVQPPVPNPPQRYVLGDTHFPYSTEPTPSKTNSFIDSTYDLTVTAVTNAASDRQSFGTITEYPTWDPSSADGKYIIFQDCATQAAYVGGNCGRYVLYDANTFAFLNDLSSSLSSPLLSWNGQAPEPRWNRGANQNPHAFTYRKNMVLREYNVDTGSDVVVHNFVNEFGPNGSIAHIVPGNSDVSDTSYFVFCNEYCSPSADTRYFVFFLVYYPNGATYYDVFVYDRQLDKVISFHDISANKHGLKGTLLSPLGNYVIVNFFCDGGINLAAEEMCGMTAYKQDFSSYVRVSNFPDHVNFALDAQGNEVAILSPAGTDNISFVRLDNGNVYQIYRSHQAGLMDYPNILWAFGNVKGWGFFGSYGDAGSADANPNWMNEGISGPGQIGAFELDETKCNQMFDTFYRTPLNTNPTSEAYGQTNPKACTSNKQRIWRIAFTQDVYGGPNVTNAYFMQVNPQINYAHTKIWFGANWRSSLNNPEVYQVTLPSTWETDLGH